MSITLPSEPTPAVETWEAYPFLIIADKSVGKSGFLASIPDYLLCDPEGGLRGYPGLKVELQTWQDHLELLDKLSKAGRGSYAGLGLDSLNVSYDLCSIFKCQQMKVSHPSEVPHGNGWGRITAEFNNWLTQIRLLGYHIVATCHSTIMEVSISSRQYNRWVPAFVGGGPSSTYQQVLKKFKVIGFMTMEEVVKPPARQVRTDQGGIREQTDVRADVTDLKASEGRVIHFAPSSYWIAGDTSHMLPKKVTLSDDWREDWAKVVQAWGTGESAHLLANEDVATTGQQVEEGTK